MQDIALPPARSYAPGIGEAVANRTINRRIHEEFTSPIRLRKPFPRRDDVSLDSQIAAWAKSDGWDVTSWDVKHGDDLVVDVEIVATARERQETWAEVAQRVALGNALLCPDGSDIQGEFNRAHHHLRQASILMSGRHLQHGDETQPERNIEVFTNCLHRDTKIVTLEYGPVEIGSIVGKTVTVRAGDGELRLATVKAYGSQKLYKLTFGSRNHQSGHYTQTVIATANHRWYLESGEVTDRLAIGDKLKSLVKHSGAPDWEAVVHGLVFGDGTAHKRTDGPDRYVSVGRTYASIRVCKSDAVRDEICSILDNAGYSFTTPPHADGDPVYYIGKFPHAKELPCTTDPDYIHSFIYGWWLADGSKTTVNALEICTVDKKAADWLRDYAAFAGYTVVGIGVKSRAGAPGRFETERDCYYIRLRESVSRKLVAIEEYGEDEVFCVEEPVTTSFTLANGLLTGNCSTSAASFVTFYLLLNGSGVGRAYDDSMMVVDWSNMPTIVPVIRQDHPDVLSGEIQALSPHEADHMYAYADVIDYKVEDSREGWAHAVEIVEVATFKGLKNSIVLLDFSDVRERGRPIGGMQNRPASGPGPMMSAIRKVAQLRDSGMAPWRSTMFVDHYLAECVLVGGARRAARMSTKTWRDDSALEFVTVKRGGFLWSSNNSVTVDQEFWDLVKTYDKGGNDNREAARAYQLFEAICHASYHDGTGEPGLINSDKLVTNNTGMDIYSEGVVIESSRFKPMPQTAELFSTLTIRAQNSRHKMITNPCGEIALFMLGGYCVIGDVVPFHAQSDDDAEDAFRTMTRMLIRTNLMEALYGREVTRTNRIGVSMTGIHEYAWNRFGFGWHDIVDEEKSKPFWEMLARFKRAVVDEARAYSESLGVVVPHTDTTIKPAGTTSKLFGLSEGAHLPSMREYLRWVQFRNDDPIIDQYQAMGYPVRRLKTYSGTTIVGFPTQPKICSLGMGDKLVTAGEATPEEQYQFLRLLEKYWIDGIDEAGNALLPCTGNQVSYTLKIKPELVDYAHYRETLMDGQSTVKCCSVMLQTDASAYEYQPEQPVTKHEYEQILLEIRTEDVTTVEDIGFEHVDCSTGACPISFNENK